MSNNGRTPALGVKTLIVVGLLCAAVAFTLWMGGTAQPLSASDTERRDQGAVTTCLEAIGVLPVVDEFGNVGVETLTSEADRCLQAESPGTQPAEAVAHVPLTAADENEVYDLYNVTFGDCMSASGYPVTWIGRGAWTVDQTLYGQTEFEEVNLACQLGAEATEMEERAARR